jgi:aspartyl/asparaginyl beta-hydroxylase (cupin superfamily)/uncharacterized protein YbdZ (MbtH family)
MSLATFAQSPETGAAILGELLVGRELCGLQTERLLAGFLADDENRPIEQQCKILFPGLESREWYDASSFAITRQLERTWPTIKDELSAAVKAADFSPYWQTGSTFLDGNHWSTSNIAVPGGPHAAAKSAFQLTLKIFSEHPPPSETLMISKISAGGHIKPHCGPWNARLIVHLGIEVPAGCTIRVRQQVRTWETGKCLVFDDSLEHECWNRSERDRSVLLFGIWHPGLTSCEITALRTVLQLLRSGFWTDQAERVGHLGLFEDFVIIENDRDHHALWPANREAPRHWRRITHEMSRAASVDWFKANLERWQ